MEILTINLPANGFLQFRKAGSYFEILSSIGQIAVNFYTPEGGQSDSIKNGLSGLFLQTSYGAFDVQDLSGAAQSIQVLVCDAGEIGGSRRQPGIVSVINAIGAGVQCRTGTGGTALTAFTATQVVAPAVNVKGIIIRGATSQAQQTAGGTSYAGLVAAPIAPTALQPANSYPISLAAAVGAVTVLDTRNDLNYQIPIGWGVWAVASNQVNAATQNSYQLVYEAL